MTTPPKTCKPLTRKLLTPVLLGAAAVLVAADPSAAQSRRPDARGMTCAQVQSLIKQRGGVVLTTGQYTFDRYVSNRSFCERREILKNDYIATRDDGQCFVQRCVQNPSYVRD